MNYKVRDYKYRIKYLPLSHCNSKYNTFIVVQAYSSDCNNLNKVLATQYNATALYLQTRRNLIKLEKTLYPAFGR